MNYPTTSPHSKRWLELATRHLTMGYALFDAGLFDGVVFHAYHAFECALNALLVQNGFPIMRDGTTRKTVIGRGRVPFYVKPDGTDMEVSASSHIALLQVAHTLIQRKMQCFQLFGRLRRYIEVCRKDSLYYNAKTNQFPGDQWDDEFAFNTLDDVEKFIDNLRRDLGI